MSLLKLRKFAQVAYCPPICPISLTLPKEIFLEAEAVEKESFSNQ